MRLRINPDEVPNFQRLVQRQLDLRSKVIELKLRIPRADAERAVADGMTSEGSIVLIWDCGFTSENFGDG